jgi:hypothetical protein
MFVFKPDLFADYAETSGVKKIKLISNFEKLCSSQER